MVDRHAHIVRWNRRFVELWGLTDAMLRERGGRDALRHAVGMVEDPALLLDVMRDAVHHPERAYIDTLVLRDGRTLERTSHPNRLGDAIAGRVWGFRDITARLRLERQLQQAARLEAVGQLASGVAHDFNNVLAIIEGHAGMLLEDLDDRPDLLEDVRGMLEACKRGTGLTRHVLAFARQRAVQLARVEIGALTDGLLPLLRRLLGSAMRLDTELGAPDATVFADIGCLEQVVVNLVVNARDAMGGKGTIRIHIDRGDRPGQLTVSPLPPTEDGELRQVGWLRLCVTDAGPGIDPDLLARIFEPFFSTKPAGIGTGLGLSIVHGIVTQHGGAVEVTSRPGAGTTFCVWLPEVASDPAADA